MFISISLAWSTHVLAMDKQQQIQCAQGFVVWANASTVTDSNANGNLDVIVKCQLNDDEAVCKASQGLSQLWFTWNGKKYSNTIDVSAETAALMESAKILRSIKCRPHCSGNIAKHRSKFTCTFK